MRADISVRILKGNRFHPDGSNEEALMRRLLILVWEWLRGPTWVVRSPWEAIITFWPKGTGGGPNVDRAP